MWTARCPSRRRPASSPFCSASRVLFKKGKKSVNDAHQFYSCDELEEPRALKEICPSSPELYDSWDKALLAWKQVVIHRL